MTRTLCRLCRNGILDGELCRRCAMLMARDPAVGQLATLLLGRILRLEYYVMKLEKQVFPLQTVEAGALEQPVGESEEEVTPVVGLIIPLKLPPSEEKPA